MRRMTLAAMFLVGLFHAVAVSGQNVQFTGDSTEVVRVTNTGSGSGIRALTYGGYAIHASAWQGIGVMSDMNATGASHGLSVRAIVEGASGENIAFSGSAHDTGASRVNFGIWTGGNSYPRPGYNLGGYLTAGSGDSGTNRGLSAHSYGGASTTNYGVEAFASGGAGSLNYGIFASAEGDSGSAVYAGFFNGDVTVTGYFDNPSDQKFKKNVSPLGGGLTKVIGLKPKRYEMRTVEFRDSISLPGGMHYGLVAQDVEPILPELVREVVAPARDTARGKPVPGRKEAIVRFKSVNYMELIPVLVGAIQEQQVQIEAMRQRIQQLEAGR